MAFILLLKRNYKDCIIWFPSTKTQKVWILPKNVLAFFSDFLSTSMYNTHSLILVVTKVLKYVALNTANVRNDC